MYMLVFVSVCTYICLLIYTYTYLWVLNYFVKGKKHLQLLMCYDFSISKHKTKYNLNVIKREAKLFCKVYANIS